MFTAEGTFGRKHLKFGTFLYMAELYPINGEIYPLLMGNYSGYRGKAPNMRCLPTEGAFGRKHLKFGDLPIMAE